jgi:AcrR family transcriptional regulator
MVTAKKTEPAPRLTSPRTKAAARPRTGGRSARVVSEVLSATLEVFAEHGYAGLSVEAVALRAGVNKTTVYRRWASKAELLGAALLSLRDEEPEPPDTGSLRKDLLQLLREAAARMATPRRRAIMQSLLLGNADPEIQAMLQRMRDTRPMIPSLVIERAIKRRELPRGSDPDLIASALIGPLHTRTYWKRQTVDDAFIVGLVNLVVAGALAGGARRP